MAKKHHKPQHWFRRRSRHRAKGMPLSVITGLAVGALAKPYGTDASPIEALQYGSPQDALESFVNNMVGIQLPFKGRTMNFDFASLNPIDMSRGVGWKTMFWTHLVTRITKKMVKTDPFSRIPVLKDYVRFS